MTLPFYYPRPTILDEIPKTGHAVVEASAGTGKTWLLEHLVIELLISRDASLDEILVVTFTEKATQEMRQRVRSKLEHILTKYSVYLRQKPLQNQKLKDSSEYWEISHQNHRKIQKTYASFNRASIFTIHGFCSRLLQDTAFIGGHLFEQSLIYSQVSFHKAFMTELRKVLRPTHSHYSLIRTALRFYPITQIEKLLWKWHQEPGIKVPERNPDLLFNIENNPEIGQPEIRHLLIHEWLPRIQAQITSQKISDGEYDFDDILKYIEQMIEGPNSQSFLDYVRQTYTYAIADEFQDTDSTQWNIFKAIFTNQDTRKDQKQSKHQLFLIGDPKQAIYSFRGADVHTYLSAVNHITQINPDRKIFLLKNYRSTPKLVAAFNHILKEKFFEGHIEYVPLEAQQTFYDAIDSSGKSIPPVEVLHLIGSPKLRANEIRNTMSRFIASEIRNIVDHHSIIAKENERIRTVELKDIFILTRTFSEAETIAEELSRQTIPFTLSRSNESSNIQVAKDLFYFLEAINQPEDPSKCIAALLTPFLGYSLEEVAQIDWEASDSPIIDFKHWNQFAQKKSFSVLSDKIFHQANSKLETLKDYSSPMFEAIIEELIKQNPSEPCDLPRILSQLRNWIESNSVPTSKKSQSTHMNAVQILTMHKAKGLEAEVVFIAGGFSKAPHRDADPQIYHQDQKRFAWIGKTNKNNVDKIQQEEKEDDERLLYVALTRAKRKLYLPYIGPPPKHQITSNTAPQKEPTHPEQKQFHYAYLKGSYKRLNDRLKDLIENEQLFHDESLFSYRPILVTSSHHHQIKNKTVHEHTDETRAPIFTPQEIDPEHTTIKNDQTGFKVTSYSKLKREALTQNYVVPWEHFSFKRTDSKNQSPTSPTDQDLPKGSETGIILHELIEAVYHHKSMHPSDAKTSEELTHLFDQEHWQSLFDEIKEKHQISQTFIQRAKQLIAKTLSLPIARPGIHLKNGFFQISDFVNEVQIDFPLQSQGEKLSFLAKSIVDFIFIHNEKIWFLDWKSDALEDWSEATLKSHVQKHYKLQIDLYTLGIIKWLAIETPLEYDQKFGGALYGFVRAMAIETPSSVYFEKPSWNEIEKYKNNPERFIEKTD